MKREIKFRGLRVDGKGWAYGSLIIIKSKYNDFYWIKNNNFEYKITPESVGQFTGLQDKNGVDIYEGDILASREGAFTYRKDAVVFEDGYFRVEEDVNLIDYINNEDTSIEVIGNIHQP